MISFRLPSLLHLAADATRILCSLRNSAGQKATGVSGATLGINVDWSQIYQDPISQLYVSNRLHGDLHPAAERHAGTFTYP